MAGQNKLTLTYEIAELGALERAGAGDDGAGVEVAALEEPRAREVLGHALRGERLVAVPQRPHHRLAEPAEGLLPRQALPQPMSAIPHAVAVFVLEGSRAR